MVPQIIHFNRVFHYKPSILGYPYFWKHPYVSLYIEDTFIVLGLSKNTAEYISPKTMHAMFINSSKEINNATNGWQVCCHHDFSLYFIYPLDVYHNGRQTSPFGMVTFHICTCSKRLGSTVGLRLLQTLHSGRSIETSLASRGECVGWEGVVVVGLSNKRNAFYSHIKLWLQIVAPQNSGWFENYPNFWAMAHPVEMDSWLRAACKLWDFQNQSSSNYLLYHLKGFFLGPRIKRSRITNWWGSHSWKNNECLCQMDFCKDVPLVGFQVWRSDPPT